MSYKNLTSETLLEDVRVEMYNASNGQNERLYSMNCATAGLLIDNIQKKGILDSCVNKVLKESFPKEVLLKFNVNDEEVLVTIINTTSDVDSEWINVKPHNEIFIDSIMFCRDLVTEVNDEYLKDSKGFKTLDEYYSKVKAKRVLITYLIVKLEEELFYASSVFNNRHLVSSEKDTKANSDIYKKFKYIPNFHLRALIENFETIKSECGRERTVSTFLAVAAKAGMLNFKPYITKNSYNHVTLVLKYNRYVHLFRGYHYQCSYTADGLGEYLSAGVRIDALSSTFGRDLRNSKLLKMFYYMNLIACCKELDVFTKLLETDPGLVDEFMKKSTEEVFDNYDITYIKDMVGLVNFVSCGIPYTNKYFNRTNRPMLPEPVEVLRVPANDTSDVCRIKVYDTNCVSVEFWMDNSVQEAMFMLPEWEKDYSQNELTYFAETEDMDTEEYIKWMSSKIYDSSESYYSLINFALNMCGCVANFMTIYPGRKTIKSNLRALNNNDVRVCKSLSDVSVERIVELRDKIYSNKTSNTNDTVSGFMSAIDCMIGK